MRMMRGGSLKKPAWDRRQPQLHQPWEWLCSLWLWPSWVSIETSVKQIWRDVDCYDWKYLYFGFGVPPSYSKSHNIMPLYYESYFHIKMLQQLVKIFNFKLFIVFNLISAGQSHLGKYLTIIWVWNFQDLKMIWRFKFK